MPNTYPHLVDRLVTLQQLAAESNAASLFTIFEDTMQVGLLRICSRASAWPRARVDVRIV